MAPSNAAWGYGSRVRFPSPRLNLTTEEKVLFLAATTLVAGPLAIMRGTGMGVSAARVLLLSLFWQDPPSPGGGGPGTYPISTNTPPSIEEVGRMITGKSGSGKSRSRRKCKPGHYWNGRKCVRIPEKGWRDFSRKYD